MNTKFGKKKRTQVKGTPNGDSSEDSRYIPAHIKREVRQRCGFGCVICGLPLYEYEHMKEWAIVREHVASDITLLCDRHHREKTNGLLGIDAVRKADASPVNRRGESEPYLFHAQQSDMTIMVGDNGFWFDEANPTTSTIILSIDTKPVLWFNHQENNLLLNLILYNKKNQVVLQIQDNELVYSTREWDITLIGTKLTIRSGPRDIILQLNFSAREKVIAIEKAALRYNGYEVLLDEKGMHMAFNAFRNCRFKGSGHLINYGGIAKAINFAAQRSYNVDNTES